MNLEIALNKGKISIFLKDKGQVIDQIALKENNNLSNTLLEGLDKIIHRNRLSKNKIGNISVDSDLPDSYTSSRIAKSVAKSFAFAKKTK